MKNRNIALCIILTLVTCGIYSLFWNVNLNNDFAEHNGKEKNGWTMILLSIITWLYGFRVKACEYGWERNGSGYE